MIDLQDPKTAALLMLDAMDVGTARIVNNHLAKRVGVDEWRTDGGTPAWLLPATELVLQQRRGAA